MHKWAVAITCLAACLMLLPLEPATGQPDERVKVDKVIMVILRDVHPLYGGRNVYLLRDGTGVCQLVSRRPGVTPFFEKRYRVTLSPDAMSRLLQIISDHSFVDIPSSVKPGLPDSARPTIFVRMASGRSVSVSRWPSDKNADFDAIYHALLEVVKSAQSGQFLGESQFDPKWVPEGFGTN